MQRHSFRAWPRAGPPRLMDIHPARVQYGTGGPRLSQTDHDITQWPRDYTIDAPVTPTLQDAKLRRVTKNLNSGLKLSTGAGKWTQAKWRMQVHSFVRRGAVLIELSW